MRIARLPEADLDRRLAQAIHSRRGIRLSHADLALLEQSGALDCLREAAEFAVNPRDFPSVNVREFCPDCSPFIYFIQAGETGPVKIGISRNPRERLIGHQTSNPYQLHLRAAIAAAPEAEAQLHRFYKREHLRGEWFRPSLRLMAYVSEIAT